MKVQDFFNLNMNFSKFEIIYGNEYLDNIIKNIRIMDVPYENCELKEEDFIITSIDFIIKEKINISNILKVIKEKNISLLGFTSKSDINDEIINHLKKTIRMSEINFPIIIIYSPNSYKDIISEYNGMKHLDSFLINEFKNNLINLKSTKYFSTYNILKIISHYINGLIIVLSSNGDILEFTDSNPQSEENNIPIDTILSLIKNNEMNALSTTKPIVYNDENWACTIYPLEINNENFGYLSIVERYSIKYETNYNISICNEAIPYLIISLITYYGKDLIYNKSIDEFMKGLLFELYSDDITIKKEAKFFNIEYDTKRYVWIINIKPLKIKNSNSLVSDNIPSNIINETLNIAKASFYEDYVVIDNPDIIFIRLKGNISNKKLTEKYKNLLNTLEFQMPEYKFSIGVSRAYDALDQLNYAYEDAIFSLKIGGKILNGKKSIYAYDDLIVYHLLYKYPDNPILERLYDNGIGKIYDYDKENNTQLLETVQVLIIHNFNLSESADKLFIHRNTLYQRIKKIEEITGLDTDNSETRLVLQLGLKIHHIFSLNLDKDWI